jgi:hypothetical protein
MALSPSLAVGVGFLTCYLGLRVIMTLQIASWGLRQRLPWASLALIPAWDTLAFSIWLVSFTRSTIRWRDRDYSIREGQLVPVSDNVSEQKTPKERQPVAVSGGTATPAELAASPSASRSAPSAN